MIVELSLMDIHSMMGSDSATFRKELERTPGLKETFNKKETYTTEKLRSYGLQGYSYVADLLEGKAPIAESAEVLVEKMIKLGWVRKAIKEEYIGILKEMPTYLLACITTTVNKELGSKR